jgi:hypothetical protein
MSAEQDNGNGLTDVMAAYRHLVAQSALLMTVMGNLGNKVELYETGGTLMTIALWDHAGELDGLMTQSKTVTGVRYDGYKQTLLNGLLQEMADTYDIGEDAS